MDRRLSGLEYKSRASFLSFGTSDLLGYTIVVKCSVGYFATNVSSEQHLPGPLPSYDNQNISRHFQMFPNGQSCH